jgi:hypothetical protein
VIPAFKLKRNWMIFKSDLETHTKKSESMICIFCQKLTKASHYKEGRSGYSDVHCPQCGKYNISHNALNFIKDDETLLHFWSEQLNNPNRDKSVPIAIRLDKRGVS